MQDPRLPDPTALDQADGEGLDLRVLFDVVRRHRWAILGLTTLITLLVALFVFRQTPVYQGKVTLLVERTPARLSPVQDAYVAYSEYYRYYETQYGLIKRRAIGERVVDKLGLATVATSTEGSRPVWQALLPEDWFPSRPEPAPAKRLDGLVSAIVGSIQVRPRSDSQLVDVLTEHVDPELAAAIANAVAEAYIEDNLEGRIEMTQRAASFLTERMVTLRSQLEASENALKDFLEREDLVDVSGIDAIASQELQLTTTRLQAVQRERAELEGIYAQIQDARAAGMRELDTIPGLLAYPQVARAGELLTAAERQVNELASRYGPLHPRMVAATNEAESARTSFDRQLELVIEVIEKRFASARAAELDAEADFQRAKGALREIDRKDFTLQTLRREAETNRQLFEKFQTQFKETDASGGVEAANARIIERARVPGSPVRPNKPRAILLALALGLLFSTALAILLEHLDSTLKGAEDAERKLGLPVLGMLPILKTTRGSDLTPLRQFVHAPKSAFAEAVRTIRTGVLLSGLDDEHRVILVTSSVPGEGKTTLSMNLAQALSELKSVLLVDADLRRPTVARVLREELDAEPVRGLSHFITGEEPLERCIYRIGDRFDVLPAGTVPPNPLELLSSGRFAQALERLAERYDHIVLDCAPALAVSDAMVLAKAASAVVYVVRADATPTQAAQAGLKRLRRSGARVTGAVLNRAPRRSSPAQGRYGAYYGDSYYSNYGYVTDERGKANA